MKKFLFSIGLLAGAVMVSTAQTAVLSGTVSGTRNLDADTCYHLQGCYVVPNNATLSIPAGTEILCASGSNLVVERGGTLTAVGNANAPIVFTSDQAVNNRAPGDWGGIAIFGSAPNNESVNAVRNVCVNRTFGGATANSNSGSLQYVRIEYAGDATDRDEPAGLLLASVGTGTTIDHIQVSESARDGIRSLGGTYNTQYLLVLNAYQNDFSFSLGNISKQQFLLGLRRDINAHVAAGSNGIYIQNDASGSGNTPLTQPLLSNATLLGPDYCGTSSSADFQNGITFDLNGAGTVRNSAIGKWRVNGLFLADAGSVAHTASNNLNFSNNAIINATGCADFAHAGSWATGCGSSLSSMTAWITDVGLATCDEPGNDFSLSDFGYNMNVCGTYCSTRPTLTYSGSGLNGVDFSAPLNTFFDATVTRKGAIQPADWSLSWAEFCPQQAAYCSIALLKTAADAASLHFVPNPASGTTQVIFEAATAGQAAVTLMDKVSGRVLQQVVHTVSEPGNQRVALSVKGLLEGVYTVKVTMKDKVAYGQLSVR